MSDSEMMDTDSEILQLCGRHPHGVKDTIVRDSFPTMSAKQRMEVINRLIRLKKIDLLSSKNEPGVVFYRLSANNKTSISSGIPNMDQMEQTVYQIIQESGNLGIGLRDLRIKTHLTPLLLNKTLKSLQTKKFIKGVMSVRENRRKVYMLFELTPDSNITGGPWYSDGEFEVDFVRVLAEQCDRLLDERWKKSGETYPHDLILRRTNACLSSTELAVSINQMGIATITLTDRNIESILDTLIYDGKIEKIVGHSTTKKENETKSNLYRSIKPLIDSTPVVRNPCGICPVFNDCHKEGLINPSTCIYITQSFHF